MSFEYEKSKLKTIEKMIDACEEEVQENRKDALKLPVMTDNGFNLERERLIDEADEKLELIKKYRGKPYFAKLTFKDKSDGKDFSGYIGRIRLGDLTDSTDNKIIDWRAPISSLYYNGRVGETSYFVDENKFDVDLKLKRQIEIKNGEVKSIYDFSETISNDEFLKPYLTQSADNRLKSIVATIQEEQDAIIRLPLYQNVVVQGVAGSGKTSVALHRLSYLMYNYRDKLKPEEYLIISPNEIFKSYISGILADLDAEKATNLSFKQMIDIIFSSKYNIQDKHEQFKKLSAKNISTDYLKFKGKFEFAKLIDRYLEDYKQALCKKPLVVDGVEILDEETTYSYFNLESNVCLNLQIEYGCKKLAQALAYNEDLKDEVYTKVKKSTLDFPKKQKLLKKLESGNFGYLKTIFGMKHNLMGLYKDFINKLDKYTDYPELSILKKYTLENIKNNKISYDDLGCVLYISYKIETIDCYDGLKYVIIDEAQDLSELMFYALYKIFNGATFCVFGDVAQGIYSYQAIDNWDAVLEMIEDSKMLNLKKSYRTSIEITQEANKVLAKLDMPPAENVIRHGDEVEFVDNNRFETIKEIVEKNLSYASLAIICRDEKELEEAKEKLKDLNLMVIDEDNTQYQANQKILLTVQTSKGLEFDCVILYNTNSYTDSPLDLKNYYVAQTRALHKLIQCKG